MTSTPSDRLLTTSARSERDPVGLRVLEGGIDHEDVGPRRGDVSRRVPTVGPLWARIAGFADARVGHHPDAVRKLGVGEEQGRGVVVEAAETAAPPPACRRPGGPRRSRRVPTSCRCRSGSARCPARAGWSPAGRVVLEVVAQAVGQGEVGARPPVVLGVEGVVVGVEDDRTVGVREGLGVVLGVPPSRNPVEPSQVRHA